MANENYLLIELITGKAEVTDGTGVFQRPGGTGFVQFAVVNLDTVRGKFERDAPSRNAFTLSEIAQLAAENCHLHLWATSPLLPEALNVMEFWGFTYKSSWIWIKPQMGLGNYWRLGHEFLLLGVRGQLGFLDHSQRSWIEADRTTHSTKPEEVRELIEKVSPGPYLELYGRHAPPNSKWTVYGNQIISD